MKECWIFGSAEIKDYSKYSVSQDAFVIAADGGYTHLRNMGINPDLILGDFDSIKEELPSDCEIITVPSEKDDTDMMLAVKKAIERGCREITICGALGGRLDHTIANLQTLEYIFDHGGNGRIFSEDNIIFFQGKGKKSYPKMNGFYFSVFAVTENITLTLSGTKYNITEHILERKFPLGVSNEIFEKEAVCDVKSGKLLVIYSKK